MHFVGLLREKRRKRVKSSYVQTELWTTAAVGGTEKAERVLS